jgi:hypothetical protein
MKTCSRCNTEKDESQFTVKNKATGLLQSICKPCKKEYNTLHYADNKAKRILQKGEKRDEYRREFYSYLMTLSCVDCGNSDFRVIEFDHLRDKSFNIADKVGDMPLKTLMKEIEKCEPVCANCHKIRTSERGGFYKFMRA